MLKKARKRAHNNVMLSSHRATARRGTESASNIKNALNKIHVGLESAQAHESAHKLEEERAQRESMIAGGAKFRQQETHDRPPVVKTVLHSQVVVKVVVVVGGGGAGGSAR